MPGSPWARSRRAKPVRRAPSVPARPPQSPQTACAPLRAGLNCHGCAGRDGRDGLGAPADGGGALRPTPPPTPAPPAPPRARASLTEPRRPRRPTRAPSGRTALRRRPQRRCDGQAHPAPARRRRAGRPRHPGARRRAAGARAARTTPDIGAPARSLRAGRPSSEAPPRAPAGAARARMRARARLRRAGALPASIPPPPDAAPRDACAARGAKSVLGAAADARYAARVTHRARLVTLIIAAGRELRLARGPGTIGGPIWPRAGLGSGRPGDVIARFGVIFARNGTPDGPRQHPVRGAASSCGGVHALDAGCDDAGCSGRISAAAQAARSRATARFRLPAVCMRRAAREAGARQLLGRQFEVIRRVWRSLRVEVYDRRPSRPLTPADHHRAFHLLPSHARARDVPTTGVQQVDRDAGVVATALRGAHTIAIEITPAKPARHPAKYGALGARWPYPRAYARVRAQTAAGRQVPCALPTSRSYPPAWILGQLR